MNIHELEQHSPGHYFYDVGDQLKQHIYRRSEIAFAVGDAARDVITTRAAVEARQRAIREFIIQSLGGLPNMDTPLNARTVGTIEGNGFRIEKIIFESRPRNFVTANLYLPAQAVLQPRGAVLFLCGHHAEAKHCAEYQMVCQQLVRAGLIVLAQDPIGQGERFSYYEASLGDTTIGWGTTEHEYTGLQCWPLGAGIARYFLHDAMRGIDYLCSRPEVDSERIGVTGNSGGGTQTCLMMLADTRIAAAAPATFLMSRESYMHVGGAADAEQLWPGFTAAGFDHEDILIAMTPRPVRVLAVTSDFFPIEGTRRTVERCQRFWNLYDQAGLDLMEDNSDHHYTPKMAQAAAEFFSRHLLNQAPVPETGSTPAIEIIEPRRLWCTNSGQVRGELEGAISVHEANEERLAELKARRDAMPAAARRERAVSWLRARVESHRQPCDLNPRFYLATRLDEMHVQMALWWSQEKLFNHGYVFRHFQSGGGAPSTAGLPVTLCLWDGGTNALQPHLSWVRGVCEQGRAVFVLDVSGSGAIAARPITAYAPEGFFGVIHKLTDDLLWLDDDLASLRIYDVLRALDMIEQWPGLDASAIQLHAHGRHGIYGRLAAVLDERIRAVESADGIESYAQWIGARHYDTHHIKDIVIHGALRHFDLPELEL